MSHKYNKDQRRLRQLSSGMQLHYYINVGYICHWGPSFFEHDLWWSVFTLYLHACQVRVTVGDSGLCCCLCDDVFRLLINSLVCWFCTRFCTSALDLFLFQICDIWLNGQLLTFGLAVRMFCYQHSHLVNWSFLADSHLVNRSFLVDSHLVNWSVLVISHLACQTADRVWKCWVSKLIVIEKQYVFQ